MNDYYLQQINNNAGLIKSNTDQIREITPIISTNVFDIEENTQELISGDILINQKLDSVELNVSILTVLVCVFFLWSCLFTFLRK